MLHAVCACALWKGFEIDKNIIWAQMWFHEHKTMENA